MPDNGEVAPRRHLVLRVLVPLALALAAMPAVYAASGSAATPDVPDRPVCGQPAAAFAHCHAHVVTRADHVTPKVSTSPTGLAPDTIKAAYGFTTSSTAGAGTTIAIVDAYDDPTAESDLGVFSSQFGLPPCTTGNGCFSKVNQSGGTTYPTANAGWALEISLDIQWAHAIAPGAKILLVEATTNSFANLLAAEDYAKTHAQYVSNSWGGSEWSGESSYDSHFAQSGVSFFVSSGDAGLPAEYPSASPNVVSVGGTRLTYSGGTLVSETGWSSGGGGCSAYETATGAQSAFAGYPNVSCGGRRATPDVSLDADPASGVSVYDTTRYNGTVGWYTVGGTSASSPMWAARSAVAGAVVNAAYVYGTSIPFRDITSGNNGASCLDGFDLCSGRGSWADNGSIATTTTTTTTAPTTTTTGVTTTTAPTTTTTTAVTTTTTAPTTTTTTTNPHKKPHP
ncbi:MAG: hypothetical protein QOI47_1388 [Actinomycetota bacterium]|nr:hypothetical protein [Actinomycetota bacterium]